MEAYRIEDLARESGATVRTIRAYQDRGLLPKPQRRGRANVYGAQHVARLRQISDLLERGYTLASIKELLEAWDAGTGLDGVLGLVDEMRRPWSSERPVRVRRSRLTATFGVRDDDAIAEAVSLGVLEPVPGSDPDDEEFVVPSPQELAVAVELYAAGVPLPQISGHLREVRGNVEHIAERFMEFTVEHVFSRFLDHTPTQEEATEAAELVRRLRPLAQQTVDAELARAMHTLTARMVRRHLGDSEAPTALLPFSRSSPDSSGATATAGALPGGEAQVTGAPATEAVDLRSGEGSAAEPGHGHSDSADRGQGEDSGAADAENADPTGPAQGDAMPGDATQDGRNAGADAEADGPVTVPLPSATVEAVRVLVGADCVAAFITAAAEREVQARVMDGLADAAARSTGGTAPGLRLPHPTARTVQGD